MKKNIPVIPIKINEFSIYLLIAYSYLKDNKERLQIGLDDLATLMQYINDPDTGWVVIDNLHSDPSTKIKQVNEDIATLQKVITKFLQYIYRNIPRKIMITQDYITLNIAPPVEHHHSKAKIESVPFGRISSSRGGIIDFDVRENPETPHKRLPDLADAIRVMGAILKPGDALPADNTECNLTYISTKAVFSETLSIKEAGNRFACYLQYVNLSNPSKDGPISELHVCIIVG